MFPKVGSDKPRCFQHMNSKTWSTFWSVNIGKALPPLEIGGVYDHGVLAGSTGVRIIHRRTDRHAHRIESGFPDRSLIARASEWCHLDQRPRGNRMVLLTKRQSDVVSRRSYSPKRAHLRADCYAELASSQFNFFFKLTIKNCIFNTIYCVQSA